VKSYVVEILVKINRKKLRKMILQELILIGEPKGPSKFSLEDQDFAGALRRFASLDYPESQIEVNLSDAGVDISSAYGVFPPVTLKTSGDETSRGGIGTMYVSGPGGLSGRFQASFGFGRNQTLYAFEVAAREILARLHGQSSPNDEYYY
jgi:hypothetical protein